MQIIDGLIQIGASVHLASAARFTDTPWTTESIEKLQKRGIKQVWLHKPSRGYGRLEQWEIRRNQSAAFRLLNWHYCSWSMRRWFKQLIRHLRPTTALINYAFADGLLDHSLCLDLRLIMEMHDLISVNRQIQLIVDDQITNFTKSGNAAGLFKETVSYMSKLQVDQEEIKIYDKYDYVIGISKNETKTLQQSLEHAKPIWLPMYIKPIVLNNSYRGNALFIASDNPFNRIALILFVRQILPTIKASCPGFKLDIVGQIERFALLAEGLRYLGFQPNISGICCEAAFAISPVFAGTGQQVKIIEAMAHGLPVVAFAGAAAGSPLVHGKNGLVADNLDEFAVHVIRLWRHRNDCERLGKVARASLEEMDSTAAKLKEIIS